MICHHCPNILISCLKPSMCISSIQNPCLVSLSTYTQSFFLKLISNGPHPHHTTQFVSSESRPQRTRNRNNQFLAPNYNLSPSSHFLSGERKHQQHQQLPQPLPPPPPPSSSNLNRESDVSSFARLPFLKQLSFASDLAFVFALLIFSLSLSLNPRTIHLSIRPIHDTSINQFLSLIIECIFDFARF